jgi:hypothetical protein
VAYEFDPREPLARALDDEEEAQFRQYARENDPPEDTSWAILHPVCREEWVKRGLTPEGLEDWQLAALDTLGEHAQTDPNVESKALEHVPTERALRGPDERRLEDIIPGERGPATIGLGLPAPGTPEFDSWLRASGAEPQYVEVLRRDDMGQLVPTPEYVGLYANAIAGEVAPAKATHEQVMILAGFIVDEAQKPAGTVLESYVKEALRKCRVLLAQKQGLMVEWQMVLREVHAALWGAGHVTHSASPRLQVADEVCYHLEQEGQNNFHGRVGPLPYPTVHLVTNVRTITASDRAALASAMVQPGVPPDEDAPDWYRATTYCGLDIEADSDKGQYNDPPVAFITDKAFEALGGEFPPFSPACLTCLDAKAHTAGKALPVRLIGEEGVAQTLEDWGLGPTVLSAAPPSSGEALHCEDCGGTGVKWVDPDKGQTPDAYNPCETCGGTGVAARFLIPVKRDEQEGQPVVGTISEAQFEATQGRAAMVVGRGADEIPADLVTIPSPDDANPALRWPPSEQFVRAILDCPWYRTTKADGGLGGTWVFVSLADMQKRGAEREVGQYTPEELNLTTEMVAQIYFTGNWEHTYDAAEGFDYKAAF